MVAYFSSEITDHSQPSKRQNLLDKQNSKLTFISYIRPTEAGGAKSV
jgi:hypothetical protein